MILTMTFWGKGEHPLESQPSKNPPEILPWSTLKISDSRSFWKKRNGVGLLLKCVQFSHSIVGVGIFPENPDKPQDRPKNEGYELW